MKSITEILGGCQMVFGISYDIQEIFEGYVANVNDSFRSGGEDIFLDSKRRRECIHTNKGRKQLNFT